MVLSCVDLIDTLYKYKPVACKRSGTAAVGRSSDLL